MVGQGDLGIGAGLIFPLNATWKIEGMADYYTNQGEIAFRAGIALIFRKF
ncbi:MAG: hypothetical protein IIB82_08270 [Bacteroidetes bacterium]|nr:hypothetical protein [Bacteroidota bacterium]